MKSKVYLETTILSYLAARKSKDPRTAQRQIVTRRWWELKRNAFDLYVLRGGFPDVAEADSVHVAAATVYECDYLVTWNIRHIANGEIRRLTERIIREHGYQTTTICTPEELFGLEALGR